MSSILSAQNLQTLRRRNSVRRCPFSLSPAFLSPARPRPPPPPPDRPCPNGMVLNLPYFESVVILVVRLTGGTPLTRLALRRQTAFHAGPLGVLPPPRLDRIDDLLVFVDADDHLADDDVHHLQPAIELL